MADETPVDSTTEGSAAPDAAETPAKRTTRKTAAKKTTATKTTTAKTAAKKTSTAKTAAKKTTTAKRTTKKAAAAPADETIPGVDAVEAPADASTEAPAEAPVTSPEALEPAAESPAASADESAQAPAKRTVKKAAAKRTTAKKAAAKKTTAAKTTAKRATKKAAAAPEGQPSAAEAPTEEPAPEAPAETPAEQSAEESTEAAAPSATAVLFQAPAAKKTTRKRTTRKKAEPPVEQPAEDEAQTPAAEAQTPAAEEAPQPEPAAEKAAEEPAEAQTEEGAEESGDESGVGRRRRRRGGRRRRKSGGDTQDNGEGSADDADSGEGEGESEDQTEQADQADQADQEQGEGSGSSRRRRRRRRAGEANGDEDDNPPNTVTRVRQGRSAEDQITALSGSTRLEAKKQRRREGREAGRRRAPIVSEAEFLARRESVERVMVIREREDLTQIAVLEDKVLVEHYVARESQTSLIGNVYLGRVQNVLPSMEAAFIDIGKGRNAVLYAGEVNWAALGWKEGQPRKIESVLTSGQKVLVQVTKDPIGHKGARLTSQVSLAGRFLVYVPDGTTSGISRKLPDTERNRLKALLKEIVPDSAGVIVRTAAEGASEDELTRDVERLKARWDDIEKKAGGNGPQLLYGEPDLTLKVVRDLFTEDFTKLVIQGEDAWATVQGYVAHVAPDLEERLERYESENGKDAFAAYRIDEQIAKGLDRKVWLPSGGSLIIDRTEAMTVIDVNTGKFTGSGGNLEETVTKNNLEAAEEIVRQLRLRDIGGIIVVDFIDMVLESNRDLVLRRLVECLGRDRTRHQVAEVTSLGLVQMTRKRIGTGLLEAFSETCEHCGGRGLIVHDHPIESGKGGAAAGTPSDEPRRRRRGGRGKSGNGESDNGSGAASNGTNGANDTNGNGGTSTAEVPKTPTPAEFAAMARHEEKAAAEAAEAAAAAESAAAAVQAPAADEAAVTPLEPVALAETETAAATEQTEAPASVTAPAASEERVAPAEPVAPEEPTKPKVVTRTRRRAASRPAGSPDQTTAVQPVVVEAAAVVVPVSEPVATPEPPRVITRTRRGASRPAGATVSEPSDSAAEGEILSEVTDGDEPHVEHVPVKKKGAKKR